MPKKSMSPAGPEDVPLWNEVLTELGDPRPYEPAVPEFTESYQPDDEPFVDPDYFDHLMYELAIEVEESAQEFAAVRESADDALDAIWKWPAGYDAYRNANEVTTQLPVVIA